MLSVRRLCLLWCACACACVYAADATAELPPLSYRYAVFAVPEPAAAAAFMAEFTGAVAINRSQYELSDASLSEAADVSGVRLFFGGDDDASSWSDVYFARDDSLPGAQVVQQLVRLACPP